MFVWEKEAATSHFNRFLETWMSLQAGQEQLQLREKRDNKAIAALHCLYCPDQLLWNVSIYSEK